MKKNYFFVLILLMCFNVKAQNVSFSDSEDFKDILVYSTGTNSNIAKDKNGNNIKVDINGDGEIQVSEALNVYQLNIDNLYKGEVFFKYGRMNGIEAFTNLTYLNCRKCNVKYLDIRQLINLQELNCDQNYMESLNVSGLKSLKKLSCQRTNFDSIDLTGLTNLEYLNFSDGNISALDLSPCINLKDFILNGTSLKSLSVGGLNKLESFLIKGTILKNLSLKNLPSLKILNCGSDVNETTPYYISKLELSGLNNLEELNCSFNEITTLDLSSCTKLKKISCSRNKLTGVLDVSDKKYLTTLNCSSNNLTSLIVKNGYEWKSLDIFFYSNHNLKYICIENYQYDFFKSQVQRSGLLLSNVEINSYCSFKPGGTSNEIKCISKIDSDQNGCDLLDNVYRDMKYDIKEVNITGSVVSVGTGSLSIPLKENTYFITPVLENPNYFLVSPLNVLVTFPKQTSPFIQDFCFTPNGIHPDLEVTLLPLSVARPGFDSKYKIVYKNKGNQTQSGSVNLTFDDTRLDFISAIPVVSTQLVNSLSWNFTNLKPFESKEIIFTLNVNSPIEIPAVNNGDILDFTANITSVVKDETPIDNTFTLNQTVVGSYDPNDKTCLEGNKIKPELIGQYVHYMIRFENTGTYQFWFDFIAL